MPSTRAISATDGSAVAIRSCRCQQEAVGDRDGPCVARVVVDPQVRGPPGGDLAGRDHRQVTCEDQGLDDRSDAILGETMNPTQHVDRLAEIDARHRRISPAQDVLDDLRRRLVGDQRDDGVRVYDLRHLRSSAMRSSCRAISRSFSVGTVISPLRAPRAEAIGSSGNGLRTSRSPSSSITTRLVRQRRRTAAGIETCPPAVILAVFMLRKLPH